MDCALRIHALTARQRLAMLWNYDSHSRISIFVKLYVLTWKEQKWQTQRCLRLGGGTVAVALHNDVRTSSMRASTAHRLLNWARHGAAVCMTNHMYDFPIRDDWFFVLFLCFNLIFSPCTRRSAQISQVAEAANDVVRLLFLTEVDGLCACLNCSRSIVMCARSKIEKKSSSHRTRWRMAGRPHRHRLTRGILWREGTHSHHHPNTKINNQNRRGTEININKSKIQYSSFVAFASVGINRQELWLFISIQTMKLHFLSHLLRLSRFAFTRAVVVQHRWANDDGNYVKGKWVTWKLFDMLCADARRCAWTWLCITPHQHLKQQQR